MKKEAINLNDSKDGYMGTLEEGIKNLHNYIVI